MVHWPAALVFAPADARVSLEAAGRVAPFEFVSVTSACSPWAGPKPAPLSFSSVPVKVCGTPISFVAFGEIEMRALAQILFAGLELEPEPLVVRVTVRPPSEVVTLAETTVVPTVDDVSVTVQLPVAPTVVHGFVVVNEPGPLTLVKLIDVPAGAFTKPAPLPSFTLTCAVNTLSVPIGFVSVCGVIWMFASTKVLTASTELPARPLVWTVMATPPTESDEVACAVTLPAVGEVKVIVH